MVEEMVNQTAVTEFFVMGFSDRRELQIVHFVVFLFIYLAALMGNFLVILTIVQNHTLHTPMYFFLANLSLSDAFYISVTVPKSMAISVTNNKLISFSGCVTQVFLVVAFAYLEFFLLTTMAYDRYVAICHPLQYRLIMNWNACFKMAAASWIVSIIITILHTANTFRLHFCQSNIKQFFCDIPQLLIISCTDTAANDWILLIESLIVDPVCLSIILISYGFIFFTVFKMQSVEARSKAFSTCFPHLTVLFLFLSTVLFSYLRPKSISSPLVDLLAAVLYTVLPPLMNPIIYSLRNKEIQVAMQKTFKKLLRFLLAILYVKLK